MMQIYGVGELTAYIKGLLDEDSALQDIWVEGEISDFSQSTAGHVYFTLKDAQSQIRCVLWRHLVTRQGRLPQEGESAILHGRVSVYEMRGVYQLYVDLVRLLGVGTLYLQFQALKGRLEAEGLFAEERKRPLPSFPRHLGVVTSPTAAAVRDILHVLERRYPLVEVILAPTLVQGDEAPRQIVEAIEALNEHTEVEAIIIARGGGSPEELWAFNDEEVARAIYHSKVPVIAGIGHETDFTIADFVADVRAPTPSVAAQVAVPDKDELRERLGLGGERLRQLIQKQIEASERELAWRERSLLRLSPQGTIDNLRQRLDESTRALTSLVMHQLEIWREQVDSRASQLKSLSPPRTLARGYAVVHHLAMDEVVKSVKQVAAGDHLKVRVSDGSFGAEVSED